MKTAGPIRSFAVAVAALSLVTSSAASAAPALAGAVNPLVTLSLFGTAQSRAALCAAGSVAAASASTATQGQPGCVLPAGDAVPPPAASNLPPPAMAPYAPYAAAAPNVWPLLAGLALFSGVFFLLDDAILGDGDGFRFERSPS